MAYLGREAAKAPIVTSDLPNDGVTLAKMAGGTDGQIITYDASGDPVAVGPGTDGQVLTSTGATSPPAFEAAAAGLDGVTTGSGNVTITDGNLILDAGNGIDFSDTANAGVSTPSELLDDYEEGTFTPAYISASGTFSYQSPGQLGTYTKIGNLVTCQSWLYLSSVGGVTGNDLYIGGMPFTSKNITNYSASGSVGMLHRADWESTNDKMIELFIGAGHTQLTLKWSRDDAGSEAISPLNFDNTVYFSCTITYHVDT